MKKTNSFKNIAILIPTYEPTQALTTLIDELNNDKYAEIVIVDDGSGNKYKDIFASSAKISTNVKLITHEQNHGKGDALKTGLKYIKENSPSIKSVITADSDGQHLPSDIKKIANELSENENTFVLGVRKFDKTTPFRSKIGNEISRKLFKFKYKKDIRDTQTGLRGIPTQIIPKLLEIQYDKYEFEMECLIKLVTEKFPIKQINIQTVYIDDNASSHFNPVVDSARIYFVFFKFLIIGGTSAIIDWVIFTILFFSSNNIFGSLLFARITSGAFNFYFNKFVVHKAIETKNIKKEIMQYAALSCGVLLTAYLTLRILHAHTNLPIIALKIMVDIMMIAVNFTAQRYIIFKKH